MNHLDDLLRGPVTGRGNAGKDTGARRLGLVSVLHQAQIVVDDVHDIQRLALVFVDALNLHIEHRGGVDRDGG